jgi:hypothetical protein
MAEDNKSDSPPKGTEQAAPHPSEGVIIGERGKALGVKPLMNLGEVPGMPDVPPAPANSTQPESAPEGSAPPAEGPGSPSGSSSSE